MCIGPSTRHTAVAICSSYWSSNGANSASRKRNSRVLATFVTHAAPRHWAKDEREAYRRLILGVSEGSRIHVSGITGRNFARKTNIRFNYFGVRTSLHCQKFLGLHSFFDPRADPPPQFSGLMQPLTPIRMTTPMEPPFARYTAKNALCIGRECDQLIFHRAVTVSLSTFVYRGL